MPYFAIPSDILNLFSRSLRQTASLSSPSSEVAALNAPRFCCELFVLEWETDELVAGFLRRLVLEKEVNLHKMFYFLRGLKRMKETRRLFSDVFFRVKQAIRKVRSEKLLLFLFEDKDPLFHTCF